ncbi:MAG: DUF1559 domain-containing protein [Lacipirellulaceae bacterium]
MDLVPAQNRSPRPLHGFTLVELLVVIAIIGILVALLLPAVQAARESARRTQCTTNLKNLVLGMVNLESTYGRLPSSGWDGGWSGDPDRGAGKAQPGNWFFSTLPFIEEQQLHDMGVGVTPPSARKLLLAQRDATPVAVANCPSRRSGGPYPTQFPQPLSGDGTGQASKYNVRETARCDYAASVGDTRDFDAVCINIGPRGYSATINPAVFPPKLSTFTGISFCGTAVKLRQVTDGLSKTVAVGERFIPVKFYAPSLAVDGMWAADDWGQFVGFQDDTVRSTYYDGMTASHVPVADTDPTPTTTPPPPSAAINLRGRELFGSAHPGGCLFGFLDGSATSVPFDVDVEVFRQMGHRADGGDVKEFVRRTGS